MAILSNLVVVETPLVAQRDDKNILFFGADADEEPAINGPIAQEQLLRVLHT